MNMKNLVFSILGILTLGVIAVIITSILTPDVVETHVVVKAQWEDSRTRMEAVLASGRDLREYRIQATYILSSIARKSDRRWCEAKIANLIRGIASQNGGSTQIHTAISKSLNTFSDTTKHNDSCRVRESYVSVAQLAGD